MMGESEGKSKSKRRRRCGKETPPPPASSALVPTVYVHPRVFDGAIRPILRQIERDLPGVTLDYEIIAPGQLPNSVNDIRLTIGVTFQYAHSSNAARFDALQEEVMLRFLAWYEDWEQMQGLPPTEGGWHAREVSNG